MDIAEHTYFMKYIIYQHENSISTLNALCKYTVKSKHTLFELERQSCIKFKSTSTQNIVLIWNKQCIRIAA